MVPIQPRHPIVLAHQVLSTQAVCGGRLTLGLGVSHHWVIDEMLGLPYEHPAATMRDYLDVLDQALAGPGTVDVENGRFRVHQPIDVTDITPTPVMIAALGPAMLRIAGARTDGTILWLADERAIGSHIAPVLYAAAAGPAGRRPVSWPGCPSACAVTTRWRRRWPGPTGCCPSPEVSPNYQKLLDRGDARTVGDILAAGSEASILAPPAVLRRRGGDRRLPPGGAHRRDPDDKLASARRTREFVASLGGSV